MKNQKQIRRTLVEELGFVNLEAYRKWIREVRPTLELTQERIENLSPDAVDCRAFWRVCDELFGADPICNLAVTPEVGHLPYPVETVMDANRMNLLFAKSLGVTAFLEENPRARLKVLEIGSGYGSLRNFLETHTNHQYTGVDVVPRVSGVLEATAEGLLPRQLLTKEAGSFSYVVGTNVFQHFSARQRSRYFHDAHALLHHDGLFIFNLTIDTGSHKRARLRDAEGNAWADHYGQYTPIPKGDAIYGELAQNFAILYVTQRYDGVFNFVCQNKVPS